MERSEIRGGIDASRQSRIALRSIRATTPIGVTRFRHHPTVIINPNLDSRTGNLMARADPLLTSGYDRPFQWKRPCDAAGKTPHRNGRARVWKEHINVT